MGAQKSFSRTDPHVNMFIFTNFVFTHTLSLSTIKHFLFISTKICSMELIIQISQIPLEFHL